MKLLKTIRLDQSDQRVFPKAAEPGEWAVPGAFVFADAEPDRFSPQDRQAFANGFLGLTSFGWSTLVSIARITEAERQAVVEALADHLATAYGAPDRKAALAAAEEEVAYASGLCDHPINTLLAVSRAFEGDTIREQFRVVTPPGPAPHARIWDIQPDEASE